VYSSSESKFIFQKPKELL